MKNFIRYNIDNVKGSKKTVSIQKQTHKRTVPKHYSLSKNPAMNHRISQLQKKLYDVETSYQQEIIQQLSSIKDDIRLIKSHIFDSKGYFHSAEKQVTQSSAQDDEPYFGSGSKQRMKSQSSEHESKGADRSLIKNHDSKVISLQEYIQVKIKRSHSGHHKHSINLKTISSIIKQYKLEGPEAGAIFYGFCKRNSHPVVVKYGPDGLGPIIQIYDKLWKNIALAKWPCVNRVLDFKRQDSSYIILQRNKSSIIGLPPKSIVIDILKILQFIHDCGYLYRNIQPQHFMLSQQGQLVIIDFKRAKRYIDIKGHSLDVIDAYNGSPFASNNQLRGIMECRKDDLESLGYLALLLMEMEIPWFGCGKEQSIRIRSALTLQQLFKNNIKWVEYMAVVMKTPKSQRPNYKQLLQILQNS